MGAAMSMIGYKLLDDFRRSRETGNYEYTIPKEGWGPWHVAPNDGCYVSFTGGLSYTDGHSYFVEVECDQSTNKVAPPGAGYFRLVRMRFPDKETLLHLVRMNPNPEFRSCAARYITGQDELVSIACNDTNWKVRSVATQRIKDQTVLSQIAQSDPHWAVRRAAVQSLTEQVVLAYIAEHDEDFAVRYAAVERVECKDMLAKIAAHDSDEEVRSLALEKLDYA